MTLRGRVAAIGVGAIVATVVVMAGLSYATIRSRARDAVDDTLRAEAERIAATFPQLLTESVGSDDALDERELTEAVQRVLAANPGSSRHLTVIRSAAGTFATEEAPDALDALRDGGEVPLGDAGQLTTVETSEGPVRVLAADLRSGGRSVGQLAVLSSLLEVRDDARRSLTVLAVTGLVALVLGGLTIIYATRRALRPLHEVAAAAQVETDLSTRVPERGTTDEVDTLAHELNRMLDRLSDDADRRTALLAAISHELRTPLAVARGHVEVFRNLDAQPGSTAAATAATIDSELTRSGESSTTCPRSGAVTSAKRWRSARCSSLMCSPISVSVSTPSDSRTSRSSADHPPSSKPMLIGWRSRCSTWCSTLARTRRLERRCRFTPMPHRPKCR